MNKFILLAVATPLISCSDVENSFFENKTNPKCIELKVFTKQVKKNSIQWKELYKEADSIGIYLYANCPSDSQTDRFLYKNVKAKAVPVFKKGRKGDLEWKLETTVLLPEENVTPYIYSPYRSNSFFHSVLIPLRIASRAERTPLYRVGTTGKGHKSINRRAPVALIFMQCVVAELSFRIRLAEGSKRISHLQAIQVGNKPGGTLCTQKAFLDLLTGQIKGVPSPAGATRLTLANEPLSVDMSKEFNIRVLPTPRPAKNGEIETLFTIDRTSYLFLLPEHTHWKPGQRYIYDLVFDGEKMLLMQTTCEFI